MSFQNFNRRALRRAKLATGQIRSDLADQIDQSRKIGRCESSVPNFGPNTNLGFGFSRLTVDARFDAASLFSQVLAHFHWV
jgi:hypothetical protein